MYQELWQAGIDWDDELPTNIQRKWARFKQELKSIENLELPRWIGFTSNCLKAELHGFCDASEKAYAAVIYSRIHLPNNKIIVQLLAAKTRVAPTKIKLTLPRLELQGALLLSKLVNNIHKALDIKFQEIHAWCDSQIVLAWLQGHPSRWKTFVSNRVGEIQSSSLIQQWHYVSSINNPADCASRGIFPGDLKRHSLWWFGPSWLQEPTQQWPIEEIKDKNCHVEEKRLVTVTSIIKHTDPLLQLLSKLSKFNKIKRVIVYCKRFINMITKRQVQTSWLTSAELQEAERIIVKLVQQAAFSDDLANICNNRRLSNKSQLLPLNPVLDEKGILRVRGRIQRSNLSCDAKQPMILPKHHPITTLIIEEAHNRTLHGGCQLTLNHLREKYWIIGGRDIVRLKIQKCVRCHRHKQQSMQQLMGDLPKARVTPARPFAKTGLDYAGPIQLRTTKGRGHKAYKGYIAIFICMATKAIHIEIVSDMNVQGFIAAYKRFTSRRGLCTDIYSDNGTYFVGANTELQKERKRLMQKLPKDVAEMIARHETTWHFIPPSASHFGGVWEAGVKSIKHHLKRVIGDTTLTFEELTTLTAQIEACLNSRPITPISNDPSDLAALTPGHFLIGDAIVAPPHAAIENVSIGTRWHLVQNMTLHFWKRWSSEYLHQLQQRPKWQRVQPNLQLGQLVLVKDDGLPPTRWKLGRIVDVHTGADNLVRVASVKCQNGIYKRPIVKLCPLPIQTAVNSTEAPIGSEKSDNSPQPSTTIRKHGHSAPVCTDRNPHLNGDNQGKRSVCCQKMSLKKSFLTPILLLTAIMNLCATSMLPFNITKFDHEPGVYFEHIGDLRFTNNNWNIVVYYNLTNYYAELEAYRRCIQKLESFCSTQGNHSPNSIIKRAKKRDACALLEPPFQQSLLEMEHKDELLHNKKVTFGRTKRGALNIVGNIASDLFGVLDERDAARYEREIEELKVNNNHLLALMKNQTSIIDATVNVFKKNQEAVDQHWQLFKTQIEEALDGNDENNNLLAFSLHTLLMMISFKETQDTLIDAVLETHSRTTTTRLLTTQQLKGEIDLMLKSLPNEIPLPSIDDTDDVIGLYQLMTTKTRLKGNYLIFELKVPLVYKESYQVYKPIPLPTSSFPSIFIRPQLELVVSDLHRVTYSSMSTYEWQNCISTTDFSICKLSQPIYQTQGQDSICEIQLLRHEKPNERCEIVERKAGNLPNTWIQLRDHRWLYSVQTEQTVSVVCKQQPFSTKLIYSGILSLDSGCTLKAGTVTIPARQVFSHEIQSALLPTFNLSSEITIGQSRKNQFFEFDDQTSKHEIEELQQRIKEQLTNDAKATLAHHHIHHYAFSYSFLALAVIIFIYMVHIRVKKRRALNTAATSGCNLEAVSPLEDLA